jgi:peptidoglycan/LPS O-acetylase OafA/YrhL
MGQGSAIAAQGRYENIDVLRGVAALLVLWLHASEVYIRIPEVAAYGTWFHDIAHFMEFGRAGVIAFFAISGFVVASTIKAPKFEGTVEFGIKRFFRLYPMYWVTVAFTYLLIWVPLRWEIKPLEVIANLSMLPSVFGVTSAMGHFWTLEIEFVFYVLVVVLFLTGSLSSPKVLVPLICLFSVAYAGRVMHQLHWTDAQNHWSQLPQCLAIMFWGSLLRRHYDPGASVMEKLRAWKTVPIIIATVFVFGRALGVGSIFKHEDLISYLTGRGTLWGLLLFVAFALSGRGWPRATVWLGTISYSIYLLHPLVLHPLHFFLQSHPALADMPVWALTAIVAAITIAVSSATYLLIEAPFNGVAARIASRFRRRVGAERTGDVAPVSRSSTS